MTAMTSEACDSSNYLISAIENATLNQLRATTRMLSRQDYGLKEGVGKLNGCTTEQIQTFLKEICKDQVGRDVLKRCLPASGSLGVEEKSASVATQLSKLQEGKTKLSSSKRSSRRERLSDGCDSNSKKATTLSESESDDELDIIPSTLGSMRVQIGRENDNSPAWNEVSAIPISRSDNDFDVVSQSAKGMDTKRKRENDRYSGSASKKLSTAISFGLGDRRPAAAFQQKHSNIPSTASSSDDDIDILPPSATTLVKRLSNTQKSSNQVPAYDPTPSYKSKSNDAFSRETKRRQLEEDRRKAQRLEDETIRKVRTDVGIAKCALCQKGYDQRENEEGLMCLWHPGVLDMNKRIDFDGNEVAEMEWSCCNRKDGKEGCALARHISTKQPNVSAKVAEMRRKSTVNTQSSAVPRTMPVVGVRAIKKCSFCANMFMARVQENIATCLSCRQKI